MDIMEQIKQADEAQLKALAESGFCTHYPGYTCDKNFPDACPKCIKRWMKARIKAQAEKETGSNEN